MGHSSTCRGRATFSSIFVIGEIAVGDRADSNRVRRRGHFGHTKNSSDRSKKVKDNDTPPRMSRRSSRSGHA